MFSPRQQGPFRELVKAAWKVVCAQLGSMDLDLPAYDKWYRDQLEEAIGLRSTKAANQTDDYDMAMLHFAEIAGDEYWLDRISTSAERRMRHVMSTKLVELTRVTGTIHDWPYARAILKHMNLPENPKDCPARLLWKVVQALDTQIRRERRLKVMGKHAA